MEIWQTKDDLSRLLTTRWQYINCVHFGGELDINGRMTQEELMQFLKIAFKLHEQEFYGGSDALWYRTDIGPCDRNFKMLAQLQEPTKFDFDNPNLKVLSVSTGITSAFDIERDLTINTKRTAMLGWCTRYRQVSIMWKGYVTFGNLQMLDTLYHEMAHLGGYWNHNKAFWDEGKRTGFGKYYQYE